MTEPTVAYCVLCPGQYRIPTRPPVDDACRSWLFNLLGDLRIYAERAAGPGDLVPDLRIVTRDFNQPRPERPAWVVAREDALPEAERDRARLRHQNRTRIGQYRDPIAALLPSGSRGNPAGGIPVSGTKAKKLPIMEDEVDLLLPARQGARELYARGALGTDDDQVGHLPLATSLETWVRDWAEQREMDEMQDRGPSRLQVGPMLRWLRARVGWACDSHPRIDEFAEDMRSYRSTLMNVLGLVDVPSYKVGVSCPKCRAWALYQKNGEWWVRCGQCPHVMSPREYHDWTKKDSVCTPCIQRIEAYRRSRAGSRRGRKAA